MTEFDYVIAGAGSAGCTLAARLAEDPTVTVGLIEAGGNGQNLFIRMPAGVGFVYGNPKFDWRYETVPQAALNGRRISFPRGKALGGSSILNGMIYMRGVPGDYDGWRQKGLEGWGFADLLPYFRRSEGAESRRDAWHGADGPLTTGRSANFGILERAFIEAAVANGHPYLDDLNAAERTGVGRTDSNIGRGTRQSSAIAYLRRVPENLKVLTGRHVARVEFKGRRAVGVQTVGGDKFRARREVILCQGAFGTPQTLMLSGVGPAEHLRTHGIDVIADLPGVGEHLADHLDVCIQYGSERADLSLARYQRLDMAVALVLKWLLLRTGPGSGAFFSTVLFHAFDDPALPELEVFMTPFVAEEHLAASPAEKLPLLQRLGQTLLVRGQRRARPGVQIDINLERPHSLGSVRLASADPLAHPLIDPNYLSDEYDLDQLRRGVRVMREIMATQPMAQYVTGELGVWKHASTDAEITAAIRASTFTGHHPCSTARMGGDTDRGSVLDQALRVRGVDGLRVCDAAAMPTQITGNLNATVIAMAEKAADLILTREPPPPEDPRTLT